MTNTIRQECDLPGLETAYIELSGVWTRGETRRFWAAKGDDYIAIVRAKLVALHLPTVGGEPITRPDEFTDERLDDVDARLFHWMSTAIPGALLGLSQAGEVSGRRLWPTSVATNSNSNTDPADRPTN